MTDDYIPWWVPSDHPVRTHMTMETEPEAESAPEPLTEMFPVLTEATADPQTEVVVDEETG